MQWRGEFSPQGELNFVIIFRVKVGKGYWDVFTFCAERRNLEPTTLGSCGHAAQSVQPGSPAKLKDARSCFCSSLGPSQSPCRKLITDEGEMKCKWSSAK